MFALVDVPARFIGRLAGPIFSIVLLAIATWIALALGRAVEAHLPSNWNMGWRRTVAVLVAVAVWLYVGAVLYEAQHWMAFSTLELQREVYD